MNLGRVVFEWLTFIVVAAGIVTSNINEVDEVDSVSVLDKYVGIGELLEPIATRKTRWESSRI